MKGLFVRKKKTTHDGIIQYVILTNTADAVVAFSIITLLRFAFLLLTKLSNIPSVKIMNS